MTETLDSSKVISTLREEIELLENTCYEQRESIAILQSLLDASSRDQSKRITNSSDRNTVCAPSPPCANETPHLHDRALVIAEQRYEAAQRAHQATALEWRKQFGLLESERDAKAKRCLELEQALEEITQSQHSRDVDALHKELHHSRATMESTRLELDETLRLTLEQATEIQEQSRVIRDLQMDLVELEGSLHQVQEERRIQDDVLQSLRKAAKDTPESEAQRLCVENQLLTERNLQLATLLAQKDLHSSTESLSTHMPEASTRAERPVPSQLEEEARTRNSIHSRLHALVSKIMKHPWDTNHKGASTIPQSKIPLHSISSESSSSLQLIKVIEEYVIHLSERFSVYQHFASDVREERRSLCSLLLREEVKRMLDNFGASSTLLPSEITDASREGESDREFADNEQSRWLEAKRRIPILLLVLSGQRMDIERSRHTGVWGQDSDHLGPSSFSFASPLRSNTDRGTVSNRRDGVVALLQSTQRCLRALQTLYHGQSSTIRGGGIPNANVTTSQPSSIRIDRTLLFEMIELLNLLVHLMRNLLESTTASVQWAVNFQDAPRFTKKTTETTRSIHSSENRSPRQLPQYVDPNVNRGSPSGTSRSGKLHPVVIATRQRFEKRREGDVAESTLVEPSHRSFVEKLSHFIHEESAAVDENHSPRMHAISRPPPSVSRKVFTNHSGK